MNEKKILTLEGLKSQTKKEIGKGNVLLILMGLFFLLFGGLVIFLNIRRWSLSGVLLGVGFIAMSILFFSILGLGLKKKRALPQGDNWNIRIEIRTVIGKYQKFIDDPDSPSYDNYLILEPGNLSQDNRYLCKGKKIFTETNVGEKLYLINVEGQLLYFFEKSVELDETLRQFVIPMPALTEYDWDDTLRRKARAFIASSKFLRCCNCGEIVRYPKYQEKCKYCKQPMGYSEEVVMDMMRRGTAKDYGQPGLPLLPRK